MEKFSTENQFSEFPQEVDLLQVQNEWAREKIILHTHKFDQIGAEVRDLKKIVNKLIDRNTRIEWEKHFSVQPTLIPDSIEIPVDIKDTLEKLEEDFSDFSNRIVLCDELKNCLSKFEEELEDSDAKYLSWFVSTIKDVFSYNYAETITNEQLDLIKKGVRIIYEKQESRDKDSFEEYHLQLVESGLSLLPTTKKAIDEFGE